MRTLAFFVSGLSLMVLTGCGSGGGNTAPAPAGGIEARTEIAQKNVDASSMTPEQKAAAKAYLRQGAEGARRSEAAAR